MAGGTELCASDVACIDVFLGEEDHVTFGTSIPRLWIWGDRDPLLPPPETRAILESIIAEYSKDFTILYYPDAGHEWHHPLYTNEAVDWIYAHME